jgi:pepsin A
MGDMKYIDLLGRQCVSSEINGMEYTDVMTAEGLEVQDQQFARLLQNETTNNGNMTGFPQDGMIGLSEPYKGFAADTFVQNLCLQGKLTECRFGLALNTAGAGSLIFDGLKENELENKRTATNFSRNNGFIVGGEVVYSVAGKRHTFQNQSLYTASENADVVGPIPQVRDILGGMNAAILETIESRGKLLFGTYPCNATPPEFGFSFKDEHPDAVGGLVWPFDVSAWTLAREGGSCTAPIVGWDGMVNDSWYLGQAWLRGKYVDFDLNNTTVTFAKLKENNDGSSIQAD